MKTNQTFRSHIPQSFGVEQPQILVFDLEENL